MKKVFFKEQEETIHVSNLKNTHIIGVEFEEGNKGFVTKLETGKYIVSDLGNNNYHSKVTGTSIADILKQCNNIKGAYVFDSSNDLGYWLINLNTNTL